MDSNNQYVYTYEITVKGVHYPIKLTIQATSSMNARNIIESQYGQDSILIGPIQK